MNPTNQIRAHHQKAIDQLTRTYEKDTDYLALIIGGSVAKGCAREDSDIDFLIVATDEAYQRRKEIGDLFINRADLCDYPGGFVDGKVINRQYLEELASEGNEPSRAAFDGAFIAFSHLNDLQDTLVKIPVYPEAERENRIRCFYAMAFIQNWLMAEADRHNNIYTKTRAASQLALFAGRLILAHNRVLYPYHKWLLHYLGKCPDKPEGLVDRIKTLLESPDLSKANALFQLVRDFKDWGVSDHQAYMWFMEDVEWSWMKDQAPLEDW